MIPLGVVAAGGVVVSAGLAYDVLYAGIPYQDPTPEMQARWRYHSDVAGGVRLAGAALAALGLSGLLLVGVATTVKRRSKGASRA